MSRVRKWGVVPYMLTVQCGGPGGCPTPVYLHGCPTPVYLLFNAATGELASLALLVAYLSIYLFIFIHLLRLLIFLENVVQCLYTSCSSVCLGPGVILRWPLP